MATIPSPLAALARIAATPLAGVPLVNGTPVLLTWNVPNDGAPHLLLVVATQVVTVAETGGVVAQTYTNLGNFGGGDTLFAGGSGAGNQIFNILRPVQPGTTFTLQQTSALTAGAATVWAEIWGS